MRSLVAGLDDLFRSDLFSAKFLLSHIMSYAYHANVGLFTTQTSASEYRVFLLSHSGPEAYSSSGDLLKKSKGPTARFCIFGSQFLNGTDKFLSDVWASLPDNFYWNVDLAFSVDSKESTCKLLHFTNKTRAEAFVAGFKHYFANVDMLPEDPTNSISEIEFDSKQTCVPLLNEVQHELQNSEIKKIVASVITSTPYNFSSRKLARLLARSISIEGGSFFSFGFGYNKQKPSLFFGCTPEKLLHYAKGVSSVPSIAGTVRLESSIEAAESELMGSQKLLAEQEYVTNFISDTMLSLGLVPQQSKKSTTRNASLLHIYTNLMARCDFDIALKLAQELHPTPAMAGVPRNDALHVIARTENYDRGLYASPLGYIDFENEEIDLNVCIRSALLNGGNAHFFAGAGILVDSDIESERLELAAKTSVIGEGMNANA